MAKSTHTLASMRKENESQSGKQDSGSNKKYTVKSQKLGQAIDNDYMNGKISNSLAQKYSAATAIALDQASKMDHDVSDTELKGMIDDEFLGMNPVDDNGNLITGKQLRGDNFWTDAVEGMRETMHNVNSGIGSGLDWGVDRFGDLAGWITGSDEVADKIKNATTGEDLAFIPSIAEDIGLAMIPGIGLPLAATKGLIESSDDLSRAVRGVDPITLQEISAGQRGAAGAGAAINTILSAVPGAGVAKGAGKKLLGEVVPGFDEATKTAKELTKKVASNEKKLRASLGKGYKNGEELPPTSELQSRMTKKGNEIGEANLKLEDLGLTPEQTEKLTQQAAERAGYGNEAMEQQLFDYYGGEGLEQQFAERFLQMPMAEQRKLVGSNGVFKKAFDNAVRPIAKKDKGYQKLAEQAGRSSELDKGKKALAEAQEIVDEGTELSKIVNSKNPIVRAKAVKYMTPERTVEHIDNALDARKAAFDAEDGNVFSKAIAGLRGQTREEAKAAREAYEKELDEVIEKAKKAKKEAKEAAKKGKKAEKTSEQKGFKAAAERWFGLGENAAAKNAKAAGRGGKLKGYTGPGGLAGAALNMADLAIQESANGAQGGLPGALSGYAQDVANGDFGSLLPLMLAFAPGPRKRVSRALGKRSGTPIRSTVPYYAIRANMLNEGIDNMNQTAGRYNVDDEAMDYLSQWLTPVKEDEE